MTKIRAKKGTALRDHSINPFDRQRRKEELIFFLCFYARYTSSSVIEELLEIDRATASSTVSRLVASGDLNRLSKHGSPERFVVTLTKKGKQRAETLFSGDFKRGQPVTEKIFTSEQLSHDLRCQTFFFEYVKHRQRCDWQYPSPTEIRPAFAREFKFKHIRLIPDCRFSARGELVFLETQLSKESAENAHRRIANYASILRHKQHAKVVFYTNEAMKQTYQDILEDRCLTSTRGSIRLPQRNLGFDTAIITSRIRDRFVFLD